MSVATADAASAAVLRLGLVDQLVSAGSIRSDEVRAAFLAVPRHMFAPEVSLEAAYANDTVRTKRDANGVTTSSISAPWLQAVMLEQAQIRPGMRCLEVGSGGFNAALMAELAGPGGEVTTVDIDSDVTDRARRYLPAAGYERVNVSLADAEAGVAAHAPYDRIVVTVGVWDIPPAWVEQLVEGGRLVVPLRMRGLSRSIAFVREGDRLVSDGHEMAGFVSVQGTGAHPEHLVTLHGEDVGLRFDDPPRVDAEALRAALGQPRVEAWSGVRFGAMEPFDGLMLWLATCLDDFCLLSRARTDTARALVDPASPIATPTLLGGRSFAYLTYRRVEASDGVFEFGAYAHGEDAAELAEVLVDQIVVWDRDHRRGAGACIRVYPAGVAGDEVAADRIVAKRHTNVTISWP